MTARQRLAARDRIVAALRKADEGGYSNAWYFYVDRRDVEAVLMMPTGRIIHGDAEAEPCAAPLKTIDGRPYRVNPFKVGECCGDPGDCDGCRS